MSLDHLLQKTQNTRKTEEKVPLFLPPEYTIDMEKWRELIQAFNRTDRKTKVADVIQQYIREKNPDRKNLDGLISIGEIVEENGSFYTDLSFENDKPGLTALVIFKAEDLQLVPVTSTNGDGGIRHVVMTYIPS
jgi:hypothetical protein